MSLHSTPVEVEDTMEVVDIKTLNEEIKGMVEREAHLRKEIDRLIVELEA